MTVYAVLRSTRPPEVASVHWYKTTAQRAAARLKRQDPTAAGLVVAVTRCMDWDHDSSCLVLPYGHHVGGWTPVAPARRVWPPEVDDV